METDEIAPLPAPVDPFAARDAEAQFVQRLEQAGYTPDQAAVKVRALLRQLATAWGLTLPYRAPGEPASGGIDVLSGLELRRSWAARPLEDYEYGAQVRYRDADGRWVGATAGSWDPGEGGLWLYVHGAPSAFMISDPARVQEVSL